MAGILQIIKSNATHENETPIHSFVQPYKVSKTSMLSSQSIEIHVKNKVDMEELISVIIPNNICDLISDIGVYFEVLHDPVIINTTHMDAHFGVGMGYQMIEWVELLIGGNVIQRLDTNYNSIYTSTHKNKSEQALLNVLNGNFRQTGYRRLTGVASGQGNDRLNGGRRRVTFPFYFHNNLRAALPLCAIHKQDIEVRIKMNKRTECFFPIDYNFNEKITNFKLIVDGIFLETPEKVRLRTKKIDQLITQIQHDKYTVPAGENKLVAKLSFVNPVKELFFHIQNESTPDGVFSYTQSGWYYRYWGNGGLVANVNENNQWVPIDPDDNVAKEVLWRLHHLKYLTLNLDGEMIIDEYTGNPAFLSFIQTSLHHSCSITEEKEEANHQGRQMRNIYNYSFALFPEDLKPSGDLDFSKIQNQLFECNLFKGRADIGRIVIVYAKSQNILRIENGTARQIFTYKY